MGTSRHFDFGGGLFLRKTIGLLRLLLRSHSLVIPFGMWLFRGLLGWFWSWGWSLSFDRSWLRL